MLKSGINIVKNNAGRSMIEMLGVLAIIGVLSVGGIAGYSKAMEKFKVNKLIAEYSEVIRGLIEYKDSILRTNSDDLIGLAATMQAANIVPNNWQKRDAIWFTDGQGNSVGFLSGKYDYGKGIGMEIYLGGTTKVNGKTVSLNFSEKICRELLSNLALPLSSELARISVVSSSGNTTRGNDLHGTKYCNGKNKKCLAQATLTDFQNMCKFCEGEEGMCKIGVRF